jgi:CRISPR-associated DxTHG motif protein
MIISILGTTGTKKDNATCLPIEIEESKKAFYNADILKKKSASFYNSTHFLLENFEDTFILIGTKCAATFQKALLEDSLKNKKVEFKEISDNDLDEVFEVIFNITQNSSEEILLDITHGFRHQPIMAIFASSLSKFLDNTNTQIIFAKEIESYKEYEYVYLDEYIEITHISMLLSGFIRTLNFIPIKSLQLINAKVFENFSKALFSNDIVGVKKFYKKLKKELEKIEQHKELQYLKPLILKVKTTLQPLDNLEKEDIFEQYLTLSKITLEKNSLIVALAYSFESLREYAAKRFEPLLKEKQIRFKNSYELNTAVMDTISNFKRGQRDNAIQQKLPQLVDKNRNNFKRVQTIYEELRKLRNDLAHINKNKEFEDIKQDIMKLNFKIETLYKDDILATIKK